MKERRIEIQAQRDILIAKKKTLQEDKSELKRTIEHLNAKLSQTQKRCFSFNKYLIKRSS